VTRRGLGRGLDALLTSTEPSEHSPSEPSQLGVREVAVAVISPNPFQPRHTIDDAALQELAASVRSHGLIQPLVVKPAEDGRFILIAGERRWRAAQLAGLSHVPVVIREADDEQMLALAIIENVQRRDLNPLEAAEGYRRLIDSFGLTQGEVAEIVGKSRPAVANTLRLLGLPDDVRHLVAEGHLSEGHARALLPLIDPAQQAAVAQRTIAQGWTVRRLESEVRRRSDPGDGTKRSAKLEHAGGGAKDADTLAAEKALEQRLETRVEIRRKGSAGQIVVHFYSAEELATLYERLVGDA